MIESIPVWTMFIGSAVLVVASIELGYRLGHRSHQRSAEEKESPVSAIAASVLGLLAFMLAFTFGLVAERYDARKGLVREEANTIRTAYFRADFLPEADRAAARSWLREYVDERIAAVRSGDMARIHKAVAGAQVLQARLWDMAVANARLDMNSDVAALYIESLNDLAAMHASRVAVGGAKIPGGIWYALGILVVLGMVSVGYQTGIAASKRSWSMPILALSFSLVLALISALDRPFSDMIRVSQQPLEHVRKAMTAAQPAAQEERQ